MSKKRLIPKLQLTTSIHNPNKLVVVITKQFGERIERVGVQPGAVKQHDMGDVATEQQARASLRPADAYGGIG